MANHHYVKCFSCHKKELHYLPRIGIANETLITINPVTIIRLPMPFIRLLPCWLGCN